MSKLSILWAHTNLQRVTSQNVGNTTTTTKNKSLNVSLKVHTRFIIKVALYTTIQATHDSSQNVSTPREKISSKQPIT